MTDRRVYGDAVAHSFGLEETPRLVTRSLRSAQIVISRLSLGPAQMGLSLRIPPEDSFVIAMYLTPVQNHEMFANGRPFLCQGYPRHGLRIVNLVGEFSARVINPHEALVFYMPRKSLDDFTEISGLRRIPHISCEPGIVDPVMVGLAEALRPGFQRPAEAGQLFVDHIALAAVAHLSSRYGGLQARSLTAKGGLSPRQAARAEAFLAGHFAHDITLGDVATYCGLSRAHFAAAFRKTTGLTPHQWLLRHRIEKAQTMMLETSMPICEIAIACGFADQSHLTRVFRRLTDESPAAWQRERRPRLYA